MLKKIIYKRALVCPQHGSPSFPNFHFFEDWTRRTDHRSTVSEPFKIQRLASHTFLNLLAGRVTLPKATGSFIVQSSSFSTKADMTRRNSNSSRSYEYHEDRSDRRALGYNVYIPKKSPLRVLKRRHWDKTVYREADIERYLDYMDEEPGPGPSRPGRWRAKTPEVVPPSDSEDSSEDESEIVERQPAQPLIRSPSTSSCSSMSSGSLNDFDYWGCVSTRDQSGISERMFSEKVQRVLWKKEKHSGEQAARMFDTRQKYVVNMFRHMYENFGTVTAFTTGMLKAGDIIYYLEAFTLSAHQTNTGANVLYSPYSTARVQMKGRFGVIVGVGDEAVKVARMTTFGHRGLASRHFSSWGKYVGIRKTNEHKYFDEETGKLQKYYHPGPHEDETLEAGFACCEMHHTSSVELVANLISLSNHIMIAGSLTEGSLKRLKEMITKHEEESFE